MNKILVIIAFIAIIVEFGLTNTFIGFAVLIVLVFIKEKYQTKDKKKELKYFKDKNTNTEPKIRDLNKEDEDDFDDNYSVWHHNRGFLNDDPPFYDLYDNDKKD